MALNEKLSKAIEFELGRQHALLERKLQRALTQRDEWKERATRYRKQILERENEANTRSLAQ